MAKLPYTFTICPTEPAPKLFTASSKELGLLLAHSPDGDLTIDDRRNGAWQAWEKRPMGANLEDELAKILKEKNKWKNR